MYPGVWLRFHEFWLSQKTIPVLVIRYEASIVSMMTTIILLHQYNNTSIHISRIIMLRILYDTLLRTLHVVANEIYLCTDDHSCTIYNIWY